MKVATGCALALFPLFSVMLPAQTYDPAIHGQWGAPFGHDISGVNQFAHLPIYPDPINPNSVFNPIHLALIPVDTSTTGTNLRGWVFAMDQTPEQPGTAYQRYTLINPYGNPPVFKNLELQLPGPNRRTGTSSVPGDIFCSGHVWTRDGRLLIAGGTIYPDPAVSGALIDGAKLVYLWDPANWNQPSGGWARLSDLVQGRYYPSVLFGHTVGADDRFYITGGGELGSTYPSFPSTYECYKWSQGLIIFEGNVNNQGTQLTAHSSRPHCPVISLTDLRFEHGLLRA